MTQLTKIPSTKHKTSAFISGLHKITPQESSKSADMAGWLFKRQTSGMKSFQSRYFTMHGRRLSYFIGETDTKERGLIDLRGYTVIDVDDKVRRKLKFAAGAVGAGGYFLKLGSPGVGDHCGITFTKPKSRYFSFHTREKMEEWREALIKATSFSDSNDLYSLEDQSREGTCLVTDENGNNGNFSNIMYGSASSTLPTSSLFSKVSSDIGTISPVTE